MDGRNLRLPSVRVFLTVCLIVCPTQQVLAGCDIDLNGVAYGDCPPRNATPAGRSNVRPRPPSPEEIAAQQAHELNNEGLAAYKAGDYAGAENLFAQALQKTPTDPMLLRNISRSEAQLGIGAYNTGDYTTALAYFQKGLSIDPAEDPYTNHFRSLIAHSQEHIAEAQHEQQTRQQMATDVDALTNIAQDRRTAPAVAGLDFAAGPDLKEAVDDSPSYGKTAKGSMGYRVAKPNLKTEHHRASGSSKADEQAKSAEATAKGGGNLTHNFDIGDAGDAGSLSKTSVNSHDQSMNPATFTDREKNATGMPEALRRLGDLQAQRSRTEADLEKAIIVRNAQKDPAKIAPLTAKVDQLTAAKGQNQKAVVDEEAAVKKIKMKVDATGGESPAQPAAKK